MPDAIPALAFAATSNICALIALGELAGTKGRQSSCNRTW